MRTIQSSANEEGTNLNFKEPKGLENLWLSVAVGGKNAMKGEMLW
jgi:hypothetical protein